MASDELTPAPAATMPKAQTATEPPAAPATADAPSDFILRTPSKYQSPSSPVPAFVAPANDWLARTWSVTHSTLSMWRSAQNVRITYRLLADDDKGRPRNEDHVEYESNKKSDRPKKVKSVEGTNTGSTVNVDGTFDWRGKGWLFFVTSHWEILGWGERPLAGGNAGEVGEVERWAVTWFAPTLFTKEGIDIYCDRREGLSAETVAALQTAMATTAGWPIELQALAKDLEPVDINLPWAE